MPALVVKSLTMPQTLNAHRDSVWIPHVTMFAMRPVPVLRKCAVPVVLLPGMTVTQQRVLKMLPGL